MSTPDLGEPSSTFCVFDWADKFNAYVGGKLSAQEVFALSVQLSDAALEGYLLSQHGLPLRFTTKPPSA